MVFEAPTISSGSRYQLIGSGSSGFSVSSPPSSGFRISTTLMPSSIIIELISSFSAIMSSRLLLIPTYATSILRSSSKARLIRSRRIYFALYPRSSFSIKFLTAPERSTTATCHSPSHISIPSDVLRCTLSPAVGEMFSVLVKISILPRSLGARYLITKYLPDS